jgi:hypothetical protein
MVKKGNSEHYAFELVIVLAIVFIVAITGLVLTSYEQTPGFADSSNFLTGFAISEEEMNNDFSEKKIFSDVGINSINIEPETPVIGESFTVNVEIINLGTEEIKTPFYVAVELNQPLTQSKPFLISGVIPKKLEIGEKIILPFKLNIIAEEGPMRILASADSTAKIIDENPSNNQMSKTFIIAE